MPGGRNRHREPGPGYIVYVDEENNLLQVLEFGRGTPKGNKYVMTPKQIAEKAGLESNGRPRFVKIGFLDRDLEAFLEG